RHTEERHAGPEVARRVEALRLPDGVDEERDHRLHEDDGRRHHEPRVLEKIEERAERDHRADDGEVEHGQRRSGRRRPGRPAASAATVIAAAVAVMNHALCANGCTPPALRLSMMLNVLLKQTASIARPTLVACFGEMASWPRKMIPMPAREMSAPATAATE